MFLYVARPPELLHVSAPGANFYWAIIDNDAGVWRYRRRPVVTHDLVNGRCRRQPEG